MYESGARLSTAVQGLVFVCVDFANSLCAVFIIFSCHLLRTRLQVLIDADRRLLVEEKKQLEESCKQLGAQVSL